MNKLVLSTLTSIGIWTALAIQPSSASAEQTRDYCVPTEVAVYEGRVHARCGNTFYVRYYSDTSSEFIDRFIAVTNAALVAGREVIFLYDTDDNSGNDRKPLAVTITR